VWAERSDQSAVRRPTSVDVAVIITKSDKEPGLATRSEAQRFFRQHAGPLEMKIRQHADVVAYFPLSAIGHSASVERDGRTDMVPGKELDPMGYEAILRWVLLQRRWRRMRVPLRVGLVAAMIIVCAGLALLGWRSLEESHYLAILENPQLSRVEKLEQTKDCNDSSLMQRRSRLFSEDLDAMSKALDVAKNEPSVEELLQRAVRLEALNPGANQDHIYT